MVNKDNDNNTEELEEITNEETGSAAEEQDLEEIEDLEANKLKKLRDENKRLDEEKRAVMEELALVKADFLNARKRLEEDKQRGIERQKIKDIEALLPLCDSFTMAMADKDAWQAADEKWRKGIEGIHAQLGQILSSHNVTEVDPTGEAFDPNQHEAIGTEVVTDKNAEGTIISVMQKGYVLQKGDTTELIRPARVTTGIIEEN